MQTWANRIALKRAFANLVRNAITYGERADVSIDADGAVLIIDDGPGMSEAEQREAVRAYARLERSRNRGTGGVGLGLAIVTNVLRRHGATLTYQHV